MHLKTIRLATVLLAVLTIYGSTALAAGIPLDDKGRFTVDFLSYINPTVITVKQNGIKTKEESGLGLDRFYVTLKYKLNETWDVRFTTDVNNEQGIADNGGNTNNLNSNFNVNVEYAYLRGEIMPSMRMRLGLAPTPWITYEELLWRHRYVSKVFSEFYQFDDLGDLGLNLAGRFFNDRMEYSVSAVNGGGNDNPSASKFIDFNSRLTLVPVRGLHFSGQFRYGYRGTKAAAASAANVKKSSLFQLLASYGTDDYRIGFNSINHWEIVSSTALRTVDSGYDVWFWLNFTPEYSVFGRYEAKDSRVDDNSVKGNTDRFLIGVGYQTLRNMRFSLAYDYSKFKGAKSASAAPASGNSGTAIRYGLYSEFFF